MSCNTKIRALILSVLRTFNCKLGYKNTQRLKSLFCDAFDLKNEETVEIDSMFGAIKFFVVNELTRWRINSFYEKEPETIKWIDDFDEKEVLWDIGANIGIYSIYAAKKGLAVLSFEPESANYRILNKNIRLNSLQNKISAFCIAFDRNYSIGKLQMTMLDEGGSMSTFTNLDIVESQDKEDTEVRFEQGMIGISIDEFISRLSPKFPNYIKIDVDGNELSIIEGASETLKDKRLKGLSIELDSSDGDKDIIRIMKSYGFLYEKKQNSDMFRNTEFSNIYNYHFIRS